MNRVVSSFFFVSRKNVHLGTSHIFDRILSDNYKKQKKRSDRAEKAYQD